MNVLRVAAFCLLIVAVCYANSIPNDFMVDDYLLVALNPAIRAIDPVQYLQSPYWGEKSEALGIYRPLVIFTFSLEYSIWQRWAPGFHIVNMLLHALNGVLVFFLARGLVTSVPAAWAAAAVFLAHPVHTESVAAIVGRSELLAGTFFFLAWLLFRNKRPMLCALAFLLSLLSKENAIAFPLVIFLDTWILEGSFRRVLEQWKRFVAPALSAVVYLALRLAVLGSLGMPKSAQYINGDWTLLQRELTSGRAFLKYFQLLLAPIDLAGSYDFNSIPIASARDWDAWLGLLLIAATIVFAFRIARTRPEIGFGVLIFYAAMLPMSNWIVPTGVLVAERYLYVPSFGIALIAGTLWTRVPRPEMRRVVAVGVLAIAALLCISHNYIWKDELTFYRNVVRVFPNNIRGRQGYGAALVRAYRFEEARTQLEAGLRIGRNTSLLVAMAGTVMEIEQSCRSAHGWLDEALMRQPREYFARWLKAQCYLSEGQLKEAEEAYRQAIDNAQFPDPKLLFEWALLLERTGRASEALAAYRRAALVDPGDSKIQQKLASLASPVSRD